MTKLNDLQSILLSTASRRDSGCLLPLPNTCSNTGARLTKALASLAARGLAEPHEASDGLFITDAGKAAIGVSDGVDAQVMDPAPLPAPLVTKSATVIALLQRNEGATLAELIAATSWLPHTTRAALTGLRKKGHDIARGKRGDQTCYCIAAAA